MSAAMPLVRRELTRRSCSARAASFDAGPATANIQVQVFYLFTLINALFQSYDTIDFGIMKSIRHVEKTCTSNPKRLPMDI